MIREVTIREGSTDYITMQLFSGLTSVDLTGNDDVELVLEDVNGIPKKFSTTNGKLVITTITKGLLSLRPACNDFYHDNSPYTGYFWVHYSPTRKGSFPEKGVITLSISEAKPIRNTAGLGIDCILST